VIERCQKGRHLFLMSKWELKKTRQIYAIIFALEETNTKLLILKMKNVSESNYNKYSIHSENNLYISFLLKHYHNYRFLLQEYSYLSLIVLLYHFILMTT
jgi:hypothetical protein